MQRLGAGSVMTPFPEGKRWQHVTLRDRLKAAAERSAATAVLGRSLKPGSRLQLTLSYFEAMRWRCAATVGMSYDSAERRGAMASELDAKGIDERTLETRIRANISQGKPATEAIKQDRGTKARKGRTQTGGAKEISLAR